MVHLEPNTSNGTRALAVPPCRKDVPWPVLPGYVNLKLVDPILKIATHVFDKKIRINLKS